MLLLLYRHSRMMLKQNRNPAKGKLGEAEETDLHCHKKVFPLSPIFILRKRCLSIHFPRRYVPNL